MNRYEQYKERGIAWLGEIPEHWEVKRLRFLLDLNPVKSELNLPEDTLVSFIPMEAVNLDKNLTLSQEKNLDEVYKGYTYFKNDDVVLAKITPCFENGKAAIAQNLTNGIAFGTTELHVLRAKTIINNQFLYYLIKSDVFMKVGESEMYGAGGQKRISEEFVKNFSVGLPPLPEQTAIADYLDKQLGDIDALIAKQQTLLTLLAEQRAATITTAVTKGLNPNTPMKNSGVAWLRDIPEHWEVKRLKFLGEIILGLTYSPENITNEDNGTLVLRSSNVQDGKLVFDDNVFVNSEIPQKIITTENDILICSRNGSRALIGKCALIEGKGLNQAFGAFMTVYRTPYRKFIYYALNSEIFKSQLGLFLTSTINQLTTQVLGNFNIAFPPLSEQTAIADYLDQKTAEIDRLTDTVNQTIGRLKEYRTALITQAVTGKIKVV
ncbi:restriction endonuclease subunit S [Bergeriella denitrificans]|uniref:Type I restriction enzyme EcoKI specificity protein n=1 Tax=Bergeriella denitrificans TaxID=494 RepID=A0A378UIH7_BERDE|nr:restriction endonuclease subunit S [Bergeriella denitrificans]STZ76533.1 Type I restriction enzyme EcoKI specificity protein [Bergeriella denitrificans]